MAEIPLPATTGVAEDLRHIVQGVCRVLGERQQRPALAPFAFLLWIRLRRIFNRFAALAAKVQAGTLRPPRPRRPAATRRPEASAANLEPETPQPEKPAPPQRQTPMPCGKFWLVKRLPEAAVYGSQLRHLLADPRMRDLLQAAPQAIRLLRPLCRMLLEPPIPEPVAWPARKPRPKQPPVERPPKPPKVRMSLLYPGYRLGKLGRRLVEWPHRLPETIIADRRPRRKPA